MSAPDVRAELEEAKEVYDGELADFLIDHPQCREEDYPTFEEWLDEKVSKFRD